MNKIFDSIRQMDKAGQEYWSARELASVIGYADYRNFSKIIDKAKVLCVQNNKSVEDHFVEVNEMVTIGSEAKRKLKSYHLSRYACLLISMSLSSKKENALPALEYFLVSRIYLLLHYKMLILIPIRILCSSLIRKEN